MIPEDASMFSFLQKVEMIKDVLFAFMRKRFLIDSTVILYFILPKM